MSAVAIIPAKGSSRRIPGKNLRTFHGQPILAYSIQAARASGLFSRVVVSTDDEAISEVAQTYGADVMMRGQKWCGDEVGPLDVARHTTTLMRPVEFVCVLYATAPLMSISDLILGWRAVQRPGIHYSLSVGTVPFLHDAAQFFWCRSWALQERMPEFGDSTVMIPVHPSRDCDINEPKDWDQAVIMYSMLHREAA
jgi:pseudaminic acid cytidylyltransferase